MSEFIKTNETIRQECPWCRSNNINGLGLEFELDDNGQPSIYIHGECHDCGVAWKDTLVHESIDFDETNMADYD